MSGAGSNLRALAAAAARGEVGGAIVLVFADRACPALDWAAEQGIETALVPGGDDATLAETLAAVESDVVVLAGYMRIVGPAVLAAFGGRILNTHPSLLPAFPGAHAVADALAHGVTVTGCTVHLVDETLDGGPIVAQEAVPVLPGDDEASLHDADPRRRAPAAAAGRRARSGSAPSPSSRMGAGPRSTPTAPRRPSRPRGGRSCRSRTRPGWSTSRRGSSRAGSSWSRPAGPRGRSATPACP